MSGKQRQKQQRRRFIISVGEKQGEEKKRGGLNQGSVLSHMRIMSRMSALVSETRVAAVEVRPDEHPSQQLHNYHQLFGVIR